MHDLVRYPIAEVFCAPQGEGFFVGALMVFVRLAGCTVGKQFTPAEKQYFVVLNNYQTKCTLADGREFACDTDYKMSLSATYTELLQYIISAGGACKTICLTGGEPLMHANSGLLANLLGQLRADNYEIHLETSGTIPLTEEVVECLDMIDHIAISPKKGFLPDYKNHVDEYKILVDEDFRWDLFPYLSSMEKDKIFLQPINFEHQINGTNLDLCLKLQMDHPEIRISMQSHKQWGTR